MRIALVAERFYPWIGGVESHVLAIARDLTANGFRPTVVTYRGEPPAHECYSKEPQPAVPVVRVTGVVGLIQVFRRLRPDVVHLHGGRSLLTARAALACRLMGIPFVITPHCFYPSRSAWDALRKALYDQAVLRPILRGARSVVALTSVDRGAALQRGAAEHALIDLPNSIDPEALNSRSPGAIPEWWDPAYRHVCSVGRLDPIKRFDLLIEAFADSAPLDYRLVLVGPDAGEAARLRELAAGVGLDGRVVFPGRVTDDQLAWVYKSSHLFVLPSSFEGLPTVVLEAMSFGIPVIASDAGGTSAVIENGRNGFLFRSGDKVDLARILGKILREGVPAGVLENARRDVKARYSWATNAPRLRHIYEMCAGTAIKHDQAM